VTYGRARARALRALARMAAEPAAAPLLREAFWDAEDDAVAAQCALPGPLAAAVRTRLAELAADPSLAPSARAAVVARAAVP
jgi:hypothetical protein